MAGVFYNTICGTDIYIYSIESSKKLKARVVTYTFSVNASDYTGPRLHPKAHARAFRRDAHMSTIIRNVGREIRDLGEKRDKGDILSWPPVADSELKSRSFSWVVL